MLAKAVTRHAQRVSGDPEQGGVVRVERVSGSRRQSLTTDIDRVGTSRGQEVVSGELANGADRDRVTPIIGDSEAERVICTLREGSGQSTIDRANAIRRDTLQRDCGIASEREGHAPCEALMRENRVSDRVVMANDQSVIEATDDRIGGKQRGVADLDKILAASERSRSGEADEIISTQGDGVCYA